LHGLPPKMLLVKRFAVITHHLKSSQVCGRNKSLFMSRHFETLTLIG
jgi:hypothetical protein